MVNGKNFSECIWVLTCDSSCSVLLIMNTREAPILNYLLRLLLTNYLFLQGCGLD